MDDKGLLELERGGVIVLNQRIDEGIRKSVTETIILATFHQHKSIVLLIDCSGGEVEIAMHIYDVIRSSQLHSIGIVIGECSSSAMLLLEACEKRLALPHARFMCHHLSFGYKSVVEERSLQAFQTVLTERLALSRTFDDLLIGRNVSREHLERLKTEGDNNQFFSTQAAKIMGFIDEEINDISAYTKSL